MSTLKAMKGGPLVLIMALMPVLASKNLVFASLKTFSEQALVHIVQSGGDKGGGSDGGG
ncbi:unnamed protein product, partial [Ilex paraguariensis]